MIEYDYQISRKDDKIGNYRPDLIPTKLPNIAYIEGPNSIGKSTLLHIISLGFYGLRSDNIHEILKTKMNNLLNSQHQSLTFKICISDKNGDFKLISEKRDFEKKDIKVYELKKEDNKKNYLSPELFYQKYKLIYDIPFNPTERLDSLINHVENEQKDLTIQIRNFRMQVNTIISEISKTDPKKLINAQERLKKLIKDYQELKNLIPNNENNLEFLEKTVYFKYYMHYDIKSKDLDKEISSLERNIIKKGKKIGKDKGQLTGIIQTTRKHIIELRTQRDDLIKLLQVLLKNKEKFLISLWNDIDFHSTVQNGKLDDDLNYCLTETCKILNKKEEEYGFRDSYKILKFYESLVRLLEDNKNLNTGIPGIEKSITEVINEIKKSIRDKQNIITHMENISSAKKELECIEKSKEELEQKYLTKLNELREEIEDLSDERKEELRKYEYSEEIKEKKQLLSTLERKRDNYEKKYSMIGKPKRENVGVIGQGNLEEFRHYTEEQLLEYISREKKDIEEKKAKFHRLETHIEITKDEIIKLEEVKPHKYQNYKNKLNDLEKKITELEQKFHREFYKYLEDIKKKKKGKENENQEIYNQAVFEFLGKMIKNIFHIDRYYKVDSINLLEGVINTKGGQIIRLSDMGTGQSQSAYLLSLLETTKDRIIIALFDEISHMDQNSLKPIYTRLKELYNKGQLLLGVLVQKSNEGVKVFDLSEER